MGNSRPGGQRHTDSSRATWQAGRHASPHPHSICWAWAQGRPASAWRLQALLRPSSPSSDMKGWPPCPPRPDPGAPSLPTMHWMVPGAKLQTLKPRDVGTTTALSVTLLCPPGTHRSPPRVGLPPSQFPDHSGDGRNVGMTSTVTSEVIVTSQPAAQGRGEAVGGRGSEQERVGSARHRHPPEPTQTPRSPEKPRLPLPPRRRGSLLPVCRDSLSLRLWWPPTPVRAADHPRAQLGPWGLRGHRADHSPTGLGQAPLALLRSPPSMAPALAGRWGRPGDTLFLCSAGCWGDRSRGSVRDDVTKEGVTREPLGLLNCREL